MNSQFHLHRLLLNDFPSIKRNLAITQSMLVLLKVFFEQGNHFPKSLSVFKSRSVNAEIRRRGLPERHRGKCHVNCIYSLLLTLLFTRALITWRYSSRFLTSVFANNLSKILFPDDIRMALIGDGSRLN